MSAALDRALPTNEEQAMALRKLRVSLSALALLTGISVMTVSGASPAAAAIGTISYGDSGSDVRIWQKDLNSWISYYQTCRPSLTVDGQFGSNTRTATRCFQRNVGDVDDGIVGPITRSDMCSYLYFYGPDSLYEATCE
jgi:peptidoglycan hydrolase-like protein with peptidoglycan-binding domain